MGTLIHICIMALVTSVVLGWSSIAASCVEIGIFWSMVALALLVSIYAWQRSSRIGQGGMLLIYCILAACITLAVASVVDIANFSFFGRKHDAETGLLLGAMLAFGTVALIAARCSNRFPRALSWGALLALVAAWHYESVFSGALLPESLSLVIMASVFSGLVAFIVLCQCKNNLSDNRYLAVLTVIAIFTGFSAPSAKENLTAAFIASFFLLLTGIQFFIERKKISPITLVAGIMLLYFGFSDITTDLFHHVLGVNEIVAGIPSLLSAISAIVLIRSRRIDIPRGLYWVSTFVFGGFGITSVIPEAYSENISLIVYGATLLFIATTVWFAHFPAPQGRLSWSSVRHGLFVTGCVIALTAIDALFTLTSNIMIKNYSPVRLLAVIKDTPLWLGDATFVRLIMKNVSLWPDDVGSASESLPLSKYIGKIRPERDNFSDVMNVSENQAEDKGFDSEGIGVYWVRDRTSLILTRVHSGSPAGIAGLNRGDKILAINGTSLAELRDNGAWKKFFAGWKSWSIVTLNVVMRGGNREHVAMKIGINPQDPPLSRIITTAQGSKVGYLYCESFNTQQFKDMNRHFEKFRSAGVQDLVLDLRYNTGGNMTEAATLANYIGGQLHEGKAFVRWQHAQRHEDLDKEYTFKRLPSSLHTRRVAVLTTDDTCSVSEVMINGLRPYMPVYTIGSTTCGKPYGMEGVEFGEKILFPVTARVVNSLGYGHYADGIRPDFKVDDDLTHQIGDPQEGMLKKALEILGQSLDFE